MRIGIFVVTPGRQGGGPETYEVQMLRALAQIDQENQYFVYCTTPKAISAIDVKQDNFTYRVLWPSVRWFSIPVTLPLMLLKDRVDLYHATMVPPPISPKPLVMSILCSSNWTHPEFYRPAVVKRLNRLIGAGMKQASRLLCISNTLRDEVHKMWGVPMERIGVSYMGVGPEFRPRPRVESREFIKRRYGVEAPYFLFIGQQQERKNVHRVIQAYAHFRKLAGSGDELPELLLVGREASQTDAIQETIRSSGVDPFVKRVGYVAYSDVPWLLNASEALLFPSLWEGFGLPIIEAFASNIPVVTSTATCLPEVAGDAALVVDPESPQAIGGALFQIHSDPALRALLTGKGLERAKIFSWEACARATLEAYMTLKQGKQANAVAQASRV